MKKFVLKQIEKKQLRIILIVFFLALFIPTGVLIYQVYDQIKWEAYHQQRLLAEELATRIDDKFINIINIEEQRAFADYTFLNIAGDPSANILQRSPLTNLSAKSDINGIIGFFQVDHQGQVSTPLLPISTDKFKNFGISSSELNQRTRKQNKIIRILTKNSLIIPKRISRPSTNKLGASKKFSNVKDEYQQRSTEIDASTPSPSIVSSGVSKASADSSREDSTGSRASTGSRSKPKSLLSSAYTGFDELSKEISSKKIRKNRSRKGSVDDIKLEEKYLWDRRKTQRSETKNRQLKNKIRPQRAVKRKERTVLPQQIYQPKIVVQDQQQALAPGKLEIFESEIDPFEFSLLDSGQFVLYRKVWRDKHRYIQGILIESEFFLQNTIHPLFVNTHLSKVSDLTIAYNKEVFEVFSSENRTRYLSSAGQLQGELLYRIRLSPPLNDVELIFSIQQLPIGPGGKIIAWTTLVLFVILCGGFTLIYRLGLKQIRLARQQQDFVSSVSHELKTPLTSIRMYGEILREGWASEEKKKSYYDYIYFESERLSRLIQNILQLARMTRNEFKLELVPVQVSALVDTIRSKVTSQVERNQFELNLNCDQVDKDTHLNIDLDHFTQIIINLVDNGVKFAAKAESKVIDINCQLQNNDRFVISIRDYGPGIAKDQLKKIFTLFYRSENELTRNTVGTGIGLSLVHQITLAMHGEIDVINHQPGAEFRVSFPIFHAPK